MDYIHLDSVSGLHISIEFCAMRSLVVALALLCQWLPLPSCCGDCCACLLLWWGREEENEVLLPHLAEMVAPALQVVVAVAFIR